MLRPAEARKGLIQHRVARHDHVELNEAVVRCLVSTRPIVRKIKRDLFSRSGFKDAVAVVIYPSLQKAVITNDFSSYGGQKTLGHRRYFNAVIIVAVSIRSVPRRAVATDRGADQIGITIDKIMQGIAERTGGVRHISTGFDISHVHAIRTGQSGGAELKGGVADDEPVDRLAESNLKRSARTCAEGRCALTGYAAIVVCHARHGQAGGAIGHRR